MSNFALITTATELPTIASAYESEEMMDVKAFLEQLHELPAANANAVRILFGKLEADYPLHPDVLERMHALYEGFCTLINDAQEISVVFNAAHEADIKRHLAPRTGEEKWNIRRR